MRNDPSSSRPRIAFVLVGAPSVRAFMINHILGLAERFDITVITDLSADNLADIQHENVTLTHVGFARKIDLKTDLKSLWQLYCLIRNGRFDAVHSLMPKTGLIAALSGVAARVPIRVHTFTGQVWATQRGFRRFTLKSLDALIAFLDTEILADSLSQSRFLKDEGVAKDAKVLGMGSVCGVDLQRFRPDLEDDLAFRQTLGLSPGDLVFGFLGRMNKDKGVSDLAAAFAAAKLPTQAKLVLVGPDEQSIIPAVMSLFGNMDGRLVFAGPTREPSRFLNMFDIFCLPSYREGFGSSAIEAAACGVPAIVSRIYGLTDAVEEGVTGLMHAPGDVAAIATLMENFAEDVEMRDRMGKAARLRAEQYFASEYLVAELCAFYEERLLLASEP